MPSHDLLKTLNIAIRSHLSSSASYSTSTSLEPSQTPLLKTLINSLSSPPPSAAAAAAEADDRTAFLLSNVTSRKLHLMLSDPNVKTSTCLQVFNFLRENHSRLSFEPDLRAHLTLICRLITSQKFTDAEDLVKFVAVDQSHKYPFSSLANWVDKFCKESRIIIKLMNLFLGAYSDHQMFDMASATFDYMRNNGVQISERTCTGHLCVLVKHGQIGVALQFFRGMIDSGMEVSVFSLTVVVNGLCGIGEMKMGRELVEEMISKGILNPNLVTFNTLVDACAKRWNFGELELVLVLMGKAGIEFNDSTYKFLIDGYSSFGKIEEAERLVLEMHDKGFKVNAFLFTTVIRGYFRSGNVEDGLSLFYKMQETGCIPSRDIYTILIDDLCKLGKMGMVEQLVIEMQEQGAQVDDVLLDILITGYQKGGMTNEVVELQTMMMKKKTTKHLNGDEVVPLSFFFSEWEFNKEPG
ncbi:hypothetical protein Dimus_019526 [Dionaea muscipula]